MERLRQGPEIDGGSDYTVRHLWVLDDQMLERIRALWREATCASTGFGEPAWTVVEAPHHRAAPPGWVGIVEVLGSVVVAAPKGQAEALRVAAAKADSVRAFSDAAEASTLFGPFEATLGPALLFYGRPAAAPATCGIVGPVPITDERVRAVLEQATEPEREESDLQASTSGVWVALDQDGAPGAVCGWRVWPHGIAHVSALTADLHRGRGFGVGAARAALDAACSQGLIPQWRAAEGNVASVATANALGLQLIGRQLSVRISN